MNPQPIELAPDAELYRRIHPSQWKPSEDRPTTGQFLLRRGERGLSFYLASECSAAEVLNGFEHFGLVILHAGDLKRLGFNFVRAYDAEDHIEIRAAAHIEARYGSAGEELAPDPDEVAGELARLAAARWVRRPG